MKYVRIQGRETAYMTGMPVGIFAAVYRLERAGILTDSEKAVYIEIDNVWFEKHLPNPPFYADDNPGKPITWFKTETTAFMIEKLQPLMDILEKYAKPYDIVYSNFPGRIVYEDEYQVAVYSDSPQGKISSLEDSQLHMYGEVIRQSFVTAAESYGLTAENCPVHWSFKTDDEIAEMFKNGCRLFGYFLDGALIGFVSLADNGGGVYEMNALSVLPEHRYYGFGTAMVDHCKNIVNENGGNKITVSLADTDTVLKGWYAANGFIYERTEVFDDLPLPVGYMYWEAR